MPGVDKGYFAQYHAPSPIGPKTDLGDPRSTVREEPSSPVRRRRRRMHVSPIMVVLILLGGWFAWASMTPGGVSARTNSMVDRVRNLLNDATSDPGLKRAANYYNEWYARTGSYPNLSDEQVRDDPTAGWGVGVNVTWCSKNAIVIESLTGNGSVSRLLIAGTEIGDVQGRQPCPTDLAHPAPWTVAAK